MLKRTKGGFTVTKAISKENLFACQDITTMSFLAILYICSLNNQKLQNTQTTYYLIITASKEQKHIQTLSPTARFIITDI